jgi:hypothetical protein
VYLHFNIVCVCVCVCVCVYMRTQTCSPQANCRSASAYCDYGLQTPQGKGRCLFHNKIAQVHGYIFIMLYTDNIQPTQSQ